MGTLSPEFVNALVSEVSDDLEQVEAIKLLDAFVEHNSDLFAKSKPLMNGYANYVMFWDGSKEGWDESNKGDELRKQFIDLLRGAKASYIYHVKDDESSGELVVEEVAR